MPRSCLRNEAGIPSCESPVSGSRLDRHQGGSGRLLSGEIRAVLQRLLPTATCATDSEPYLPQRADQGALLGKRRAIRPNAQRLYTTTTPISLMKKTARLLRNLPKFKVCL